MLRSYYARLAEEESKRVSTLLVKSIDALVKASELRKEMTSHG